VRFALRLGAVALAAVVYVVVSLFALSALETSTAGSGWFFAFAEAHSQALADARTEASRSGRDPSTVWSVCGYPPKVSDIPSGEPVRTDEGWQIVGTLWLIDNQEFVLAARCLNRRGYLSIEALTEIEQGDDASAGIVTRHRTATFVAWLAALAVVLALAARWTFRRRPRRTAE
jgi:hypothetical protein